MYQSYIDPYANTDYVTVGYWSNPYDAGVFYCPYVPLQMVTQLVKITSNHVSGLKLVTELSSSNPFVGSTPANGLAAVKTNPYYRIFKVTNILT